MGGKSGMDKYTEFAIAGMIYVGGSVYRAYKSLFVKKEKRILVTRMDAIGDMTCTSPFLRELRRSYPEHRITLVCHPAIKNMVECCPYIDEILTYDNRVNKHRFMTNVKLSLRFARKYLLDRNYEMAIAPYHANTGIYPDQYICLLSGAGRRVAYSELVNADKHEYYMGLHDRFFNDVCYRDDVNHEVESTLGLLEHILGGEYDFDSTLELWTDASDGNAVDMLFSELGVDSRKLNIVVNLSTSNKTKDWDIQNYIDVSRLVAEKYEVNLLLIGAGEMAFEYAEKYQKQLPYSYNLVNRTTLRQTAEIIRRSRIYLGGDTGPLHMAAAFGLEGVAIYKNAKNIRKRPRPDEWYGPWKSPIHIVQPKNNLPGCEYECAKDAHCINQVTVAEVFDILDGILLKNIMND